MEDNLFCARTAETAAAAGGIGKFRRFFKRRIQRWQDNQLRHFLPGFKDKFGIVLK